ncbi:conserved repeat domain protein, partial [Vibrio parahaemolyticus V-223/04]
WKWCTQLLLRLTVQIRIKFCTLNSVIPRRLKRQILLSSHQHQTALRCIQKNLRSS